MDSEMVIHNGGCHCRNVRWRVRSPASVVAWSCNCSDCGMRGNTHFVVPFERFELLGDSEKFLTTYTFGTHTAKHTFCKAVYARAYPVSAYRQKTTHQLTLSCKTLVNYNGNLLASVFVSIEDGERSEGGKRYGLGMPEMVDVGGRQGGISMKQSNKAIRYAQPESIGLCIGFIGNTILDAMDKYVAKRKAITDLSEEVVVDGSKQSRIEINLADLPTDPGLRTRIWDYNPSIRDEVRRAYLLKGPCQPRKHEFPYNIFGSKQRRFNPAWFDEFSTWLEYSVSQNAAYCLCCYLFKPNIGAQAGGDSFVGLGFKNWAKKDKLRIHVGGVNSAHNQAWSKCAALLDEKQRIEALTIKHPEESNIDYKIYLDASIDCLRFLLRQGIAFRDHVECETSSNRGNFVELLQFLANHNKSIEAATFNNVAESLKLTSSDFQKAILNAVAAETMELVRSDIGDDFFSVHIDECYDVSIEEQMSVVVRYVDKKGHIIERFLGIEHVPDATSISLKKALDDLFSRHGLSISNLRGQSYNGECNMQSELCGLQTLILDEIKSAYYLHCFAHQLQCTLVAVAKNHLEIACLFLLINKVVNVVRGSCKCHDRLREKKSAKVIEELSLGVTLSDRGLNQETSHVKAGDTHRRSHYDTLLSMIILFPSVIDVLEIIEEDGLTQEQKSEARMLSISLQDFGFIFCLHFMRTLLGITNQLSQALQRKEEDIVNAMNLVGICKKQLQDLRDNGWDSMLKQVTLFCKKHDIDVCNMDGMFSLSGRSRLKAPHKTNLHYYHVELFYGVIDLLLTELENRFSQTSTDLLISMSCLNPSNSFSSFDKNKVIDFARFYPDDFSEIELLMLDDQLETYILDMQTSTDFSDLKGIGDLARKMVETKRDKVYTLVYLLIKLALILPVATATVERTFSAMRVVKNRLLDGMGDQWMNDALVAYIEKDVLANVDNENIIDRIQKMNL
ncbi:hypothetical protein OSB04_027584 [Centaurea solstitialis]|uniref:CENP-V/GFA domain-containing protein n=1 Tax=Centaurea solstitialis TaxID=347529 RepID=A0AA38SEX0_9ASTR|nr:hypothetical protein OSB04_027584 [Centaurea solstitialis]